MTMVRFIKNIILLVGMLLMSLVGVGQDLTKFSGRTCSNGGDLSTPTTSWQTKSGTIASNGFTRHDVYLTTDKIYTFTLCPEDGGAASIDTYMGLFNGWGCAQYTSENLLAYDDDGCSGNASKITYRVNSTGWATLYITAYSSNKSGTYTLKYKYENAPTPPSNYLCSSATSLACGASLSGTTVGTTGAAHGLPSGASVSNYGVWYTFIGNGGSTTITVTPASGYDTEINVVSGSCGSFNLIGSRDNGGSGTNDTYTFTTTANTTYYVYVAHYSSGNTTTGSFTISRTCNVDEPTPIVMECGVTYSGTLLTIGVWSGYTDCTSWGAGGEQSYSYTPPITGEYTFTTTTISGDPDFFIMTTNGPSGTNIAGECWGSGNKIVTLTGGQTYYFIADNYSTSNSASFTVSVSCPQLQTYTITYNANGGTGNMTDSNNPYNEGSTVTILANIFTPPNGKVFDHWNTQDDDGGTSYNPNETFTISENITLYAIWRDIPTVDELPGQDCETSFSNNSDYIVNFSINEINNTTGFTTGGYAIYINQIATFDCGETYNGTLTNATDGIGSHSFTIWIDFNNNGEFENSERVSMNTANNNVTTPFSIVIPDNVRDGLHLMRVIFRYNSAPEDIAQCESGAYGEGEDYIARINCYDPLPINLLEFYATPDHLTLTPTNNIYIKTGGEWNNCEYIIYRSSDAINWDYDNPVIDWDFSDNPHDASANANYSENSYMEYFPIDYNPYDTTYYKLIQRDCDNTAHEYTSEIIVCINMHQKKSNWDYFSYTYEGLMVTSNDKPITIICYNILGQMIYQTDILSNDNIILTIKPPYIVTIYEDGTPVATEKVFR